MNINVNELENDNLSRRLWIKRIENLELDKNMIFQANMSKYDFQEKYDSQIWFSNKNDFQVNTILQIQSIKTSIVDLLHNVYLHDNDDQHHSYLNKC